MPEFSTLRDNLPDFKRQMDDFSADMQKNIFRAGIRAAAIVFQKRVSALAPVLRKPRSGRAAGLLKRSIFAKRLRPVPGEEHYLIGVLKKAFYGRFVEEGHLARGPGNALRGGKHAKNLRRARLNAEGAKRVPAYPFLKPAFDLSKDEALDACIKRIQDRIDKENAKRT